eukprot:1666454-Pyramimonas_sp.AAC.1
MMLELYCRPWSQSNNNTEPTELEHRRIWSDLSSAGQLRLSPQKWEELVVSSFWRTPRDQPSGHSPILCTCLIYLPRNCMTISRIRMLMEHGVWAWSCRYARGNLQEHGSTTPYFQD